MALIRGSEQAASGVCTPTTGTASGDMLVAFLVNDTGGATFTAPDGTWTLLQQGSDAGPAHSFGAYYKVLSAAPAANYTFTTSAGSIAGNVLYTLNPNGQTFGTPTSTITSGNSAGDATLTSTAITLNPSPNVGIIAWSNDDDTTVSVAPSGMTLDEFFDGASTFIAAYSILDQSNATYTNSLRPATDGSERICIAVSVLCTVAGPTINTQPTAQTARLHGEADTTATFTVSATASGGSLSYDWELETSVGGGSYSNLADGSGATWSGQAAASAVGTFSATTLSGRRVRCNVTDSNGTTTTNAVALTVLNGPVLSKASGTTNGVGVDTLTVTTDDVTDTNGEYVEVTATVDGVVARLSVNGT